MRKINFIQILAIIVAMTVLGCRSSEQKQDTEVDPLETLNQEIEESPKEDSLLISRARLFKERENYDLAVKDVQKAMYLNPDRPDYYALLADYLMLNFQSRQAAQILESGIIKWPVNPGLRLKAAQVYTIFKNYPKANTHLTEGLPTRSAKRRDVLHGRKFVSGTGG